MHKGVHLRTALRIWWKAGHCCTLQATKWKSMSRNPKSVEKLGMTSKIHENYMILYDYLYHLVSNSIHLSALHMAPWHSTCRSWGWKALKSTKPSFVLKGRRCKRRFVVLRFSKVGSGVGLFAPEKQTQVFAVPRNRSISAFPAFSVLRNGKFWGIGVVFGVCCVLMCVNVCY